MLNELPQRGYFERVLILFSKWKPFLPNICLRLNLKQTYIYLPIQLGILMTQEPVVWSRR